MVQVSTSKVLDVDDIISPDYYASVIAKKWTEFNYHRAKWIEEKKELRNYLFATDTRTTSNSSLPHMNSTTTPKLTQLRDNLHANYTAHLFPNSNWLQWKAHNEEGEPKAKMIRDYMKTKLGQSSFRSVASKLVADYIDYGNVFAMVEHVNENITLADGSVIPGYVGPVVKRISPFDIAFDPTAERFEDSPKIIKKIVSMGDIAKAINDNPEENASLAQVFDEVVRIRNVIRSSDAELHKSEGFVADGFSNLTDYYDTDYVELLTFYGNMFNHDTGELLENVIITVADRSRVISIEPNPSWLGQAAIRHASWRDRPDNLYGMGPLDNLVGLQYRIDHLENMKADVWDQIAHPKILIQGEVEPFTNQPGEKIYLGDEGSVAYLAPDPTALNADQQIDRIQFYMEELAGAPRNAMGLRTPGEKTAFEVDTLNNAANRVFKHKTAELETNFFEPLFNDFLEVGRRNLPTMETIEMVDDDTGTVIFEDITVEDITARGKLFPMGARHIAERNTRLQNLQQMWQMKASDPTIGVHISGKELARIIAEELNEPNLFEVNVGVLEQMETQGVMEEAAVDFEEQQIEAAEEGI